MFKVNKHRGLCKRHFGMILAGWNPDWGMTVIMAAGRQPNHKTSMTGGSEMNGLEQVVVYMWFLPVILFIILSLCLGVVWLPISLLVKLIRREAVQNHTVAMVRAESG